MSIVRGKIRLRPEAPNSLELLELHASLQEFIIVLEISFVTCIVRLPGQSALPGTWFTSAYLAEKDLSIHEPTTKASRHATHTGHIHVQSILIFKAYLYIERIYYI